MVSEETTDLHSALTGVGLGPMQLNPSALTSRPPTCGDCGHPISSGH